MKGRRFYIANAAFAALLVMSIAAYGNVGYFDGVGQTIRLEKTADIQMVSEDVTISLLRSGFRVSSFFRNGDNATYRCKFRLKNLTDKEIAVPIGFPLGSQTGQMLAHGNFHLAEVISHYKFIAATDKVSYAIKYVPYDEDKKYGNIFLWDMKFKPNETICLSVSYQIPGRIENISTDRVIRGEIKSENEAIPCYLELMNRSMGESWEYVTTTGNSWAGNIEKAVFRVFIGDFEDYLRKRGVFENLPTDRHYKNAKQAFARYTNLVCYIQPAGWIESQMPEFGKTLTWKYTNFKPTADTDIKISCMFTGIPVNQTDYDRLTNNFKSVFINALKQQQTHIDNLKQKGRASEKLLKNERRKLKEYEQALSPQADKDIADVILEFYGIKTDNPRIQPFLKRQVWYPVKNPPEIDPHLKTRLLEVSAKKSDKKPL